VPRFAVLALFLAACGPALSVEEATSEGGSTCESGESGESGESSSSTGEPESTGGSSTSGSSSTGSTSGEVSAIPAQACFGALCSADLPCGGGLRCLAHPDDGVFRCAVAGCITGSPCDGNAAACGDPLLGAPLGVCDDATGQGQCHVRLCDGTCEVGWCVDGQCY